MSGAAHTPTPYVYSEVGEVVGVTLATYTQLAEENDALVAALEIAEQALMEGDDDDDSALVSVRAALNAARGQKS